MEVAETIIVGAGQAGLAMSFQLTQHDMEHIVLERGNVGEQWTTYWDSFTLLTPNVHNALPGYPCAPDRPDGFLARDEFVAHLRKYAASFAAPILPNCTVVRLSLAPISGRYLLETSTGRFVARNVVVATGPFQRPVFPAVRGAFPVGIAQFYVGSYRSASQLPSGAVLVIGSGAAGCQIADDLRVGGRQVYLSVGRYRRKPRRYRGQDHYWWSYATGHADRTVDSLTSKAQLNEVSAALSGVAGGYSIDLRKLGRDGVTLLGRIRGFRGPHLILEENLIESISAGDRAHSDFRETVDRFIERSGWHAPVSEVGDESVPSSYSESSPDELDLSSAGIASVVWATGFTHDFPWIDLECFEPTGAVRHNRGVTELPGLYFLGLKWLYKWKSFFIGGVGEDASYLAMRIASDTNRI